MADKKPRRPPATTIKAREDQLIAMAFDHAEKQFQEGTASSQVTTHFLQMGSEREALAREKLRRENLLLEARVDQIEALANMENLASEAIKAMRTYVGLDDDD